MRNKRIVAVFSLLFLLFNFYGSKPVYANDTDTQIVNNINNVSEDAKKAILAEITTCMQTVSSDVMNVYDKKKLVDKIWSAGDFMSDSAKGCFKVVTTSVNGTSKVALAMTSPGLDYVRSLLMGMSNSSSNNGIVYTGGGSYSVTIGRTDKRKIQEVQSFSSKCKATVSMIDYAHNGNVTNGDLDMASGDSLIIVSDADPVGGYCSVTFGGGWKDSSGNWRMTGHAMSVGNQDYCSATCTYWGVQRNLKDVVNWDSVNSASFSNGYSDYCIPIDISTLKPIDADVMDKVLPSSGKVSDLPSNYKTDNYTKDTGSNTGSDSSSFSLPNVLGSIVDLFKALLDAVNSILHFFTIDFSKVSSHMNYGDIMKSHFSPVFDVFNLFSNVHVDSSTTSSDAGKFYMKIPKAMGGDDQEHCVLDLTVGAVYVNKAREIIKYGIWIYFLWYLFRNFSPKFNVGG